MRRLGWALAVVGGLAIAVGVVYADGRVPALMPPDGPLYAPEQLEQTFSHQRSDGRVDYAALAQEHWHLDTFVRGIAAHGPENLMTAVGAPAAKLTRQDETAYWLNVYNALALEALVADGVPSHPLRSLRRWLWSWPVAGDRLTLHALEERVLPDLEDPRVFLALHDGRLGGPRLPRHPFTGEQLDVELNEAVRAFFARPDVIRIRPKQVELSQLVLEHQEAILEALPKNRPRNLLQFVWAFLPDACEDRPGCETRADLDQACGARLESCQIVPIAVDERLDTAARSEER